MICRIYDVAGATLEQYDQVNEQLGSEKPEGVHAHIAGSIDGGIRVIEVWDSTEHIDRYMQSGLAEALERASIPEPKITDFEVHNFEWTD